VIVKRQITLHKKSEQNFLKCTLNDNKADDMPFQHLCSDNFNSYSVELVQLRHTKQVIQKVINGLLLHSRLKKRN